MVKHDKINAQAQELLLQMMETELGGEQVYRTALTCVLNDDLKKEWEEYCEETIKHQEVVRSVCEALGVDSNADSPGRQVVKHIGNSLVKAMKMASDSGDRALAELVACECVVHAETKDHANWELLDQLAEHMKGESAEVLKQAYDEVAQDEHHHLFHTKGWGRELWIQHLGMKAVLPPPEEVKHVESAIGASRAEQQREKML
ncbi:hypothetical protein [Comamonas sp. NLF-1-9]|uniref:hypothetical protein n=1 Tax=Comamonas sp. NLF-1-9 TaxID=2853163 RepID=UPI001C460E37|nr:hypothetical protein [Comamonas sp. NLF-1-9]QXL85280.1 hypothetical protein KUD94_04715 [Comamonas sp. NLF-1-9]